MLRATAFAALLAAPALAAPIPASDLLIRDVTPQLSYRWRAAPEAATQPAPAEGIRSEALTELAKEKKNAARDAAEAKNSGFPFRAYETIVSWTLAADTPHLLALEGLNYSFTGGAHGNTGYSARIWDKNANKAIPFSALFTDWKKAQGLLGPAYCKALAEEQKARGGNPVNNCPKLADQQIVPWADLASTAAQFRVLIGPYAAGSYAEGSYLITLPWPVGIEKAGQARLQGRSVRHTTDAALATRRLTPYIEPDGRSALQHPDPAACRRDRRCGAARSRRRPAPPRCRRCAAAR